MIKKEYYREIIKRSYNAPLVLLTVASYVGTIVTSFLYFFGSNGIDIAYHTFICCIGLGSIFVLVFFIRAIHASYDIHEEQEKESKIQLKEKGRMITQREAELSKERETKEKKEMEKRFHLFICNKLKEAENLLHQAKTPLGYRESQLNALYERILEWTECVYDMLSNYDEDFANNFGNLDYIKKICNSPINSSQLTWHMNTRKEQLEQIKNLGFVERIGHGKWRAIRKPTNETKTKDMLLERI